MNFYMKKSLPCTYKSPIRKRKVLNKILTKMEGNYKLVLC